MFRFEPCESHTFTDLTPASPAIMALKLSLSMRALERLAGLDDVRS